MRTNIETMLALLVDERWNAIGMELRVIANDLLFSRETVSVPANDRLADDPL